jgi:4-diphosphocytidyl-2-C-methyl-D-erythritol kinase
MAYRVLQEQHTLPGLDIHLHKVIPPGAGLGGGSADAAFFLKSLNEHFELNIAPEKLKITAGRLGADCTFFLDNRPAYAIGTGDQLSPIEVSLSGYHLLIVKPIFGVDTKEAYAEVIPHEYPFNFKEILGGKLTKWKNFIRNDFEKTLFVKFPELGLLKDRLASLEPVYTSMSGSGSSVYAIFDKKPTINSEDFPPGYFIWQEDF